MSADGKTGCKVLAWSLCWGLLGASVEAPAEDPDQAELELLEYLGSWEASDEDWMIFTEVETEAAENESKEEGDNDPPPDGEKLAEPDDES